MYVSIVGICMLIVFTVLIVTKKVSVLTALIGVPILSYQSSDINRSRGVVSGDVLVICQNKF